MEFVHGIVCKTVLPERILDIGLKPQGTIILYNYYDAGR